MDYIQLNEELRNFCKQLINDGYTKSQICSIVLGQQKLPMFNQFIEDENRNFGIGVLSQIFDVLGYTLDIVPVMKSENDDDMFSEFYNKFKENYHLIMIEGLTNQEKNKDFVGSGRDSKVQQAITDVALDMFNKILQK